MDQVKMGKFIHCRRKDIGLTQQELADRLFVTDKAVSKWERGIGAPNIGILEALSDVLEVSVPELLSGELNDQHAPTDNSGLILESAEMYASIELKKRKKQFVIFCIIVLLLIVALSTFASYFREKQFLFDMNYFETTAIDQGCLEVEDHAFNEIKDRLEENNAVLYNKEYDNIMYCIGSTDTALAYADHIFPNNSELSIQAKNLLEEVSRLNEYLSAIDIRDDKYMIQDTIKYREIILQIQKNRQKLEELIRQREEESFAA